MSIFADTNLLFGQKRENDVKEESLQGLITLKEKNNPKPTFHTIFQRFLDRFKKKLSKSTRNITLVSRQKKIKFRLNFLNVWIKYQGKSFKIAYVSGWKIKSF